MVLLLADFGMTLSEYETVPIAEVANKLSLDLHQLDTFRGWEVRPRLHRLGGINTPKLIPL